MSDDRRVIVEYETPRVDRSVRPPNWIDLHPDRLAMVLLAIAICAFVAVHFTRNEPHEWAMCVLFSAVVWAPWGTFSSLLQLLASPYDRRSESLTALCIYIGVAVAMVAILRDHSLLGEMELIGQR